MTDSTTDAEFTNIEKDKKIEGNNFALMTMSTLPRHHLLKDGSNENREREIENLQLDVDLGLRKQYIHDAKKLYNKDVNQLTEDDFPEINNEILSKIFSMNKLKFMCFIKNAKTVLKLFIPKLFIPVICALLCILTVPFLKETFWVDSTKNITDVMINWTVGISIILCVIAFILCALWAINFFKTDTKKEKTFEDAEYGNRREVTKETTISVNLKWEVLKAELKFERLKETDLMIPYGAKLRLKEAENTNIFHEFMVVHPHVHVDNVKYKKFKIKVVEYKDPAIIGIINLDNGNKRMFLITLWDVVKDVERAIKKIKNLSDFKIPENMSY